MRMNAKRKEKTRRETTAIKVWVTPAEKAAIAVKADAYSLSASTYLRELALRSTRPPTRYHTLCREDGTEKSVLAAQRPWDEANRITAVAGSRRNARLVK